MYEAEAVLFATPVALSITTLSAAHWFPWHWGAKPLDRLTAYTVGTSVVVGYPVLAMLLAVATGQHIGTLFWALLLIANTVASGATVQVAYWIDSRKAVGLEGTNNATRGD